MGRGLERPLLRLGLTTNVSVDASVGDVDAAERHGGGTGGVLLVVGGTSSVWRSASGSC